MRVTLFVAASLLVSCASGPTGPKTGTPEYYWQVALETYDAGDYAKTIEHLDKIFQDKNEIQAKAAPLRLVVLAGLTGGHRELADQYGYGADFIKTGTTAPFRREMDRLRAAAGGFGIRLGEAYRDYEEALPQGDITIEFPYPSRGTMNRPPQFTRIAAGQLLPDSDSESLLRAMVQRSTLQQMSRILDSRGDFAKAQEKLKTLPVTVPRADFEATMGEALFEAATIFGRQKRAEPPKEEFLFGLATKAVEAAGKDKVKEFKAEFDKLTQDMKKRKK